MATNSSFQFLSSPREIQITIAENCESQDLCNLCRTSRGLYELCIPVLYHDVDLSIHNRGLVRCNRPGIGWFYLPADYPTCENVPENARSKQERFLGTLLDHPDYRGYVRSLTWTFLVLNTENLDPDPYAEPEVFGRPLIEIWNVMQSLTNLKHVDFAHLDFYQDIDILGESPTTLFSSATSVRIAAEMKYCLATSVLHSIDPSKLVHLCLSNVQDPGQLENGDRYESDVLHSEQTETRLPDGDRGRVLPGAMRGLLPKLSGHCTALRSLILQKSAQAVHHSMYWNDGADTAVYEEWAAFVASVTVTLQTFQFEQGLKSEGEGIPPGTRRFGRRSTPNQPIRPMDERFMQTLFPVLVSGLWPCLKVMEIRGIGAWKGVPAMNEWKKAELREAVGQTAMLVIEEEASRTFEHAGQNDF
ncbi:hypothetical protein MMC24_002995 [Lignoscripta atroalba]|nr:hypothetical protein [Lignoscripta atroalba]